MRDNKRIIWLIVIMTTISLSTLFMAIYILYRTSLGEERSRLVVTARSQARLIESIARFNAEYSKDYPKGPRQATLSQIIDAHENYEGFGETGEFTLARKEGNNIIFLLSHRHFDLDLPKPVSFDSDLAEPMRRALTALSGTVIGLDYRGEQVLAAHEPVAELDLGIVAKIDLAEIRAPFIRAGLISLGIAILFVTFGAILFIRISEPMLSQIRESEEKYRATFEQAAVGIIRADPTGPFLDVNQRFCEMIGYSREEILSLTFLDITHPDDVNSDMKYMDQLIEGEIDIFSIEKRYIHKDGSHIWGNLTVSLVYDGSDEIKYAIAVVEEISDRKRIEKELTKHQEYLEELVEERSKELVESNEKLLRAQRMESLGLLAGGVAHDLNNIIGPLVGYPDLVLMNLPSDTPVKDDLLAIKSSAERAAEVIADLLALARRGKYEMHTIDLNNITEKYMKSLEFKDAQMRSSNVLIEQELSDKPLHINGSEAHIHKVIMNVVNNAIDSMDNGGVLTIRSKRVSSEKRFLTYDEIDEGEYIVLEVEDQGAGISEKDLGVIFDPFFTTKKKVGRKGTGLGLSVVHGIVKDHGAYIDVESQLGLGTKICLYFPSTTEVLESKSNNHGDYSGTDSILIIDDDEDQIKLALKFLTALGYKVYSAESGRKAIDYLKKNSVDLILLDMIMEDDFSGLDTYRDIVKINPAQKAIIVSGFSETDQVREALNLGAGKYIKKPYDLNEIGKAIREELDKE